MEQFLRYLPRIIGGVLIFILCLIFWPVTSVPTGYRGVITVGGSIKNIESEGFLIIMPWQKLSIFNVRAEQADVKNAEGATSDTQPVKVSMTVRYSVRAEKVAVVFEQFSKDGNLDNYIDTATHETFKAVTAKYTAVDLIAKRVLVSNDIASLLRSKVEPYGAQIINIDMTNFSFNPDYMAAINEKVTQEQKRLAAENKVLTVEAEQKQKVAVALAEANAVKATADGAAYAQVAEAKAYSQSIKLRSDALAASTTKDFLELKRIDVELEKANKWNGVLPSSIYAGAPIPFLQVK